jgi:hypothetical protein
MSWGDQVEIYDPAADAAERWPEWTVRLADLHGLGEVIDLDARVILTDSAQCGPEMALAHSLSHLDLGHLEAVPSGRFSEAQEADADWLAEVRLDLRE